MEIVNSEKSIRKVMSHKVVIIWNTLFVWEKKNGDKKKELNQSVKLRIGSWRCIIKELLVNYVDSNLYHKNITFEDIVG